MHLARLAGLALLVVGGTAAAERLYVCGWELQTTRAGVETDPGVGATGGTSIEFSPTHGGVAVARAVAIAGARSSFRHFFETSTPAMFARVYVRLEQAVNAQTMFLLVRRSSAVPAIAWLTLDPQGRVGAQVWLSSMTTGAQLTVGTWHRFDIFVDERGGPGTHVVQVALDGQTIVLVQNLDLSHLWTPSRWGSTSTRSPPARASCCSTTWRSTARSARTRPASRCPGGSS